VKFAICGLLAIAVSHIGLVGQAPAPDGTQNAGSAPGETLSESYRGSQRDNVEYQKILPIKVFDNLYYVGPGFVSLWLIPTSDGLIPGGRTSGPTQVSYGVASCDDGGISDER
jgi:hypothetical protein